MFDRSRHKTIIIKILKAIYSDIELRSVLGFKGRTAAFLFYGLPRLSVDLDFDLLEIEKKKVVFSRLKKILPEFGELIESREKRYTLFFLISYQKGEKKVKVEVSKRVSKSAFGVKNYLGIPVLVMKKEDMVAGKLSALLTRKKFAARDLFDLWFFLKNDWGINEKVVKAKTGLSLKMALSRAVKKIKKIKKNQLLQGLGEFLDDKQKPLVKKKMQEETLFYLKLMFAQSAQLVRP